MLHPPSPRPIGEKSLFHFVAPHSQLHLLGFLFFSGGQAYNAEEEPEKVKSRAQGRKMKGDHSPTGRGGLRCTSSGKWRL